MCRHKTAFHDEGCELAVYASDPLLPNGRNLLPLPLIERRQLLERLVSWKPAMMARSSSRGSIKDPFHRAPHPGPLGSTMRTSSRYRFAASVSVSGSQRVPSAVRNQPLKSIDHSSLGTAAGDITSPWAIAPRQRGRPARDLRASRCIQWSKLLALLSALHLPATP